jgi:hypothetical protein
MKILVDGKEYALVHSFRDNRAIIDMDGLYVLVDKAPDGIWDLSGEPAREGEKEVLQQLIEPMNDQSILTVTPPDDPSS